MTGEEVEDGSITPPHHFDDAKHSDPAHNIICLFTTEPLVQPDTSFQSSSSPSSPTLTDPDPPSPPRNHITVAKKQQWARQGPAALPRFLTQNSAFRASDQERPTEISQDASGQAWSQRLVQDKVKDMVMSYYVLAKPSSCSPLSLILLIV